MKNLLSQLSELIERNDTEKAIASYQLERLSYHLTLFNEHLRKSWVKLIV